ncbi:MAG: pyridoxamine 5'-phosphate oxidase family protein [Chloroflexota bacterium]|nr:pyridoxamine 5'-phosphate oxidase family protein [Dehalococcoidia bacterium]MDW8254470.1 pyridoxamine 5'-phosphate oxidase family protein [Chloroflexota bacterium]
MDPKLLAALQTLHKLDEWVALATTKKNGEPHVKPMMMGYGDGVLLFSMTGKQAKLNLQRDPRACVTLFRPGDYAHVVVWGTMELRDDAEAQEMWNTLIRTAFGEEGLAQRQRTLSIENGTCLGVFTPRRWRIYGLG